MFKMFNILEGFNNSKLLAGLAMILLNIGSKYIEFDFSKTQEQWIKYNIGREILIFVITFTATHDIIISLLLTAAFVILSDTIFNENSKYCLVSEKLNKLKAVIDTDKDDFISDEEISNAHSILYKANIQKNKITQLNNLNYFNNNI